MRWIDKIYLKILRWSGRAQREQSLYDDSEYAPEGFLRTLRSFGRVIGAILLFPLFMLFLPFRGLNLFHHTGEEFDEGFGTWQKIRYRIGRAVKAIVLLPIRLFFAVLQILGSLFKSGPKEALFVLPALSMICLMAFVFVQVFLRADAIELRYQKGADIAFVNRNYTLAKTYYERIRSRTQLKTNRKFMWAQILSQTGEAEKADDLINQLAPDDDMGYAPAHRLKALMFANRIGQSGDTNVRRKLRWHLDNANDDSSEILQAWAAYYLAAEQFDKAVKVLQKSADKDPKHYLMIAHIYHRQERPVERRFALQKAEKAYAEILERDNLNHRIRITLASIKVQLEKHDQAGALMEQGVRLQPDDVINLAMAEFLIVRHDFARANDESIENQLSYLVRVLNLNPNYAPVYQRLRIMYMNPGHSEEELAEVRKTFQTVVAGDHPTPMAHFALSNVLWQEKRFDEAQFHIQQAYELNPEIVVIVNNLAWMLAHAEDPDLDRALELSETAIQKVPQNRQFRDTRGTILMKMGRYKDALPELEKSLPGVNNKAAVHKKLAIVYEKLGMKEMAQIHLEQSE